ncbi:penicillin-binding protein 2 [Agrococcus versicolor]|uniref:Penicillin-binding protein 2 n=1 Tax=Agrococcus versicolor TaxID=501482 RepID=A0ABP5MJY9_9MICO
MPTIQRIARATRVRSILTAIVVVALVGACVVRLVDIQLVRAEALNADASGRVGATAPVHGTRGDIVDANGTVLAGTVDRWDLTISPQFVHDLTERDGLEPGQVVTGGEIFERLAAITGDDPLAYQAAVDAALQANPESDYLVLDTGLDGTAYQSVRDLQDELPIGFVTMRSNPQRIYPSGSVAGNLVGFMGTDDPLAGLEMTEDQTCLAPEDGTQTFERGADGTPIPGSTVVTEQSADGGTLGLTIDADVQFQAQQLAEQYRQQYQAEHANVIVARTDGSLVAVAETPSVDPNDPGATDARYRISYSFAQGIEPGSIFKTMAMAAMLDLGLVEPGDEMTVPWRYDPDGPVRVQDAHSHPDMQWTATGAYVQSSNVGMVQLAQGMDRDDYFDYLSGFGFGQADVGFPGEEAFPLASDPSGLDAQTQLNVLFGQGIQVTPMQLVGAYQAIANGGVRQDIHLVDSCTLADGTVVEQPAGDSNRVVSEDTADTVLRMMEHVVTDYGNVTFPIPGYRVAAKTGTAEVVLDPSAGYDPVQRIVTTAGVFPADDPQFVVYVQLDLPQTERTSAAAIPLFHDMVSVLIREYDIPPSTSQAPNLPLEWTD